MVVEFIRYRVPPNRQAEFEHAWSEAQPLLRGASQGQSHEVARAVEDQAVKPLFEQIEEMRHYESTGIGSGT